MEAPDQAYIAALWEHPHLCLAFFGIQFHSEEGMRLYQESGMFEEVPKALAQAEGLLLNRALNAPEGPLLMQYWRSYEDLDAFARKMPHTAWWKWLIENKGKGVSFYHEIYRAKTAEAIFEVGMSPVGPGAFCSLLPVPSGEGKSKERQSRFEAATTGA